MDEIVIELVKAVGKSFLNPILYWIILLIIFTEIRRIRQEENMFQRKIFPVGSIFKGTWLPSIFTSIVLSLLTLFIGIPFSLEIVLLIAIIVFLLSFTFGYKFLSASFTLGVTFIFFKWLTSVQESPSLTSITFSSLALFVGLLLFAEANMYKKVKNETAFPEINISKRGALFGQHHLKRLSFLPFFVLVPDSLGFSFVPLLPYFSLGDETYRFVFIPFVIGFHHIIHYALPETVAKTLSKMTTLLGAIVLVFSFISFYLPGFATLAIVIAIFGRWYIEITASHPKHKHQFSFLQLDHELKVLAIIPDSPAEKIGIRVGDTITKVNDKSVSTIKQVDAILAERDKFPSFEVVNSNHEIEQIHNDAYLGDRTALGIVFVTNVTK